MLLGRVVHRGLERVEVGDVDGVGEAVDLLGDRLGVVAVDVEDRDPRALGRHAPARLARRCPSRRRSRPRDARRGVPSGATVTVALSLRAHSGAWLSLAEHLHDAQGVGGSNPSAPTRLSPGGHRPRIASAGAQTGRRTAPTEPARPTDAPDPAADGDRTRAGRTPAAPARRSSSVIAIAADVPERHPAAHLHRRRLRRLAPEPLDHPARRRSGCRTVGTRSWDPPIFYPAPGTLAYSDTLLPVALVHWPLRLSSATRSRST